MQLEQKKNEHINLNSSIIDDVSKEVLYTELFLRRKFSRIGLFQLFEWKISHKLSRALSDKWLVKHFKGKIFMDGNRFVKFVKISPSKKPTIQYIKCVTNIIYAVGGYT